jgi:hypothetical protein
MILNQTGLIFNLNNASNVYNSATGLWLSTNSSTPLNSEIGTVNSVAGKFVKSSSVSNLPAGSNTESLYYIFQKTTYGPTAYHVGFASTYENAENKIPIIFTTAGDLFSFRQTGHSYRLKPLYLQCCEDEIYDTQLPPPFNIEAYSPWEIPGPEKIRKMISFTLSGVTVTGYVDSPSLNMGDINDFATIINGTYNLYVGDHAYIFQGVTSGYTGTYPILSYYVDYNGTQPSPMIFYKNEKRLSSGFQDSYIRLFFSITLLLNNITQEVTATYNLGFEGTASGGYVVMGAIYSGTIVFTSMANINSGDVFDTIPTLNLVSSGGYYGNWPATITPVFSGDYVDELLPATITLEKITEVGYETKLERLGAAYPARGWTTNDYTASLPSTIVLSKISDRTYESDPFTLAVNVVNKVRLKLMVLPSDIDGGAFGFVFIDRYSPKVGGDTTYNYISPLRPFRFYNNSGTGYSYDGSLFYTAPTGITSSLVTFYLFRESGILCQNVGAPEVSECFATTNYKINIATPPPS